MRQWKIKVDGHARWDIVVGGECTGAVFSPSFFRPGPNVTVVRCCQRITLGRRGMSTIDGEKILSVDGSLVDGEL